MTRGGLNCMSVWFFSIWMVTCGIAFEKKFKHWQTIKILVSIVAVLILRINVDMCRWIHMSKFVYGWPCLYFIACVLINKCEDKSI